MNVWDVFYITFIKEGILRMWRFMLPIFLPAIISGLKKVHRALNIDKLQGKFVYRQDKKNNIVVPVVHQIQELNLILLGKTGEGKSATGNLILGKTCFEASNNKGSCTKEPTICSVIRNDGLKINVVDTPGLCDTQTTRQETLEKIVDAVSLFSKGFNALVFVINFAGRSTKESTETYRILNECFGQQMMDHCIVVVTHGSLFDINAKDKTFGEWCAEQCDSELGNLFTNCKNRVVLFYNEVRINKKTNEPLYPEDAEKQRNCVDELLCMVQQMPGRYTNTYFENCAIAREKIAIEENLPALKTSIQNILAGLIASFQKALNDIANEREIDISDIHNKASELVKHIENTQGRTDALSELHEKAITIQHKIEKLYLAKEIQQAMIKEIIDDTEALKNPPSKLKTWGKFITGYVGSVLLGGVSCATVATAPSGLMAASAGIALANINLKKDLLTHADYDVSRKRLDVKKACLRSLKSSISEL